MVPAWVLTSIAQKAVDAGSDASAALSPVASGGKIQPQVEQTLFGVSSSDRFTIHIPLPIRCSSTGHV
eukprot:6189271-Alexandrium_andersonii.AAC.1